MAVDIRGFNLNSLTSPLEGTMSSTFKTMCRGLHLNLFLHRIVDWETMILLIWTGSGLLTVILYLLSDHLICLLKVYNIFKQNSIITLCHAAWVKKMNWRLLIQCWSKTCSNSEFQCASKKKKVAIVKFTIL